MPNIVGTIPKEADLQMQQAAACRMEHDAVGHYARPDVLELIVRE